MKIKDRVYVIFWALRCYGLHQS